MLTTHTGTTSNSVTLVKRHWDGSIEQTSPGVVYVLCHELTRFKKRPEQANVERFTKAVFWSKEAARAYVKAEYGYDDEYWVEGDPDGGYDCIVESNDREQLILSIDRTDLVP